MPKKPMGDVIVLLPGILGSVLAQDGKEVWAPSGGAVLRGLFSLGRSITSLELHGDPVDQPDLGDGVEATRLMPDVHIIPGFWGIDGYTGISSMITDTFDVVPGKTYIEFPYDWRRDNRVAAQRLADRVAPLLFEARKDNPDAKLILIGHSMGGLVARYFLECLDGWRDTRMLITFGTPYRGSVNALDFIANGFVKKVGPFKVADLSKLLLSLTSVYQLLPVYPCLDVGGADFVRVAESQGVPNLDLARATSALQDFHRAIERGVEARGDQPAYSLYPVVGITQGTSLSATLQNGHVEILRTWKGRDLGGDGTVPRVSATPIELGNEPMAMYASERHASLQGSGPVQTQLLGILTQILDLDSFRAPGAGLRLDADELFEAGETIPVEVTVHAEGVPLIEPPQLVATIEDAATGRAVLTEPVALETDGDRHHVELPPVPVGTYRLRVEATGLTADQVQPVHGLFVVADDHEPELP